MKTVRAPAYWAPAIINIDYSGMNDIDKAELNNWLAKEGLSFTDCLSCSDESFPARFNGYLTDCLEYTFNK